MHLTAPRVVPAGSRKRRLILLAAAIASSPAFAEAPTCKVEDAKVVVERLMAASFSPDCASELRAIGASRYWTEECRSRAVMLDAAMRFEYGRRTSARFKELVTKDGVTYAVVTMHGPNQFAYQTAVERENYCRPTQSGEWTLYQPPPGVTGCGEAFWAGIPVEDYPGAFPITCVGSEWVVADPE